MAGSESNVTQVERIIKTVIEGLLDDPSGLSVKAERSGRAIVVYTIELLGESEKEIGRLVGRNGYTIEAIRWLVKAIGTKHGLKVILEIVDPKRPEVVDGNQR